MGNWNSRLKEKMETPQERYKRLVKEHGVLIPPSFINNGGGSTSTSTALPISSHAMLLVSQSTSPSLLDYIWRTSLGTRLLHDYRIPGISIHIPTSGTTNNNTSNESTSTNNNNNNHLYIHLPSNSLLSSTSTTSTLQQEDNLSSMMILVAQQSIGPRMNLQLLIPNATTTSTTSVSNSNYVPSFQISAISPSSQFGIRTCLPIVGRTEEDDDKDRTSSSSDSDSGGQGGWLEAKYRGRVLNGMDIIATSWMTWKDLQRESSSLYHNYYFDSSNPTTTTTTTTTTTHHPTFLSTRQHPRPRHPPGQLHFQLGIDYEEALLAIQTKIPLTSSLSSSSSSSSYYQLPNVEKLISINLNHHPPAPSSPSTNPSSSSSSPPPPPLWLTLKQETSSSSSAPPSSSIPLWTLNLSQIITWDRSHWNPLDDRAPYIRQTLGWVVQVEQQPSSSTSSSTTHPSSSSSSSSINTTATTGGILWSAGVTMQWNRHLATKFLWKDNGKTWNTNILFKQWKEPSVTLCLLHSLDLPTGKTMGWGLGFEIQTTTTTTTTTTTSSTLGIEENERDSNTPSDYPDSPSPRRNGPPTRIQIPNI